jgi:transcriptional regulator with XRE-family HTH domain
LAGFSQQEAAKELGYANSSKLAKIEGATDTNSVPLLTIRKAAELYEVSTDFLFGLTEDWDIPPGERHQRQIGRWLFDSWQVARERDLAALSDVSKAMSVVAGAATHLADGADDVQRAFDKVRDLNTNFDDLIGGARLQASIEALADAGRQARLQLRRLHLEIAGDGSGARP